MFELGSSDGGLAVVPAQLSEVGSAVNAVLAVDVGGLGDAALRSFVVGLEKVSSRLDAARAMAVAELDERGQTDEWDGLRTGEWVARETRTPVGQAKRRVTVSRRLVDEFPGLLHAIADGHLSWFHADAFCRAANPRIAGLMALLVGEFVALARGMPFGPWCRELQRAVARLDVDGGHDPAKDGDDNRLYLSRRFDGVRELAGRFAGVEGAAFEEMLDAETDRQFRLAQQLAEQTSGETEIPTRAQLRAAALLELVRRGTGAKTGAGTAVELTLAQHSTSDDCCNDHVEPPDVPDDPMARARQLVDGLFESTYGDIFRFFQLDTLLCDPIVSIAQLQLAGLDGSELNLHLGRSQRLASAAQRKAAFVRDGGCVWPGCDAHVRHCDLHHVQRWDHGGLTDIENLACLCRFHHGVTHRAGWSMSAVGDGTFTWTTPSGRTLHSQQHGIPSQRAGP